MTVFIAFLILLSAFTFMLGITLPLVKFESFIFFSETPSLIEIVWSLYQGEDAFLAILVALFSIGFPILKQLTVLSGALGQKNAQSEAQSEAQSDAQSRKRVWSNLVPALSKWSMMDVLLVAIVIVGAKTSGLVSAISQPGVWFYAISALATTIAHYLISKDR